MPYICKPSNVSEEFWESFYSLKSVESIQDLLIYCKDGIISTSQVLLAATSSYMRCVLHTRHHSEESGIQSLILPDVSVVDMKQVMCLVHSGEAVIDHRNIAEVLTLARFLGIEMRQVTPECLGFIALDKEGTPVKSEPLESEVNNLIRKLTTKITPFTNSFQVDPVKLYGGDVENCKKAKESDSIENIDDYYLSEYVVPDETDTKCEPKMDQDGLVEALAALNNSSLHLDNKNVICGVCQKMIQVPGDRKLRGKYKYFKKNHFATCLKKKTGETLRETDTREENFDESDDEDCLEVVYQRHEQMRNNEVDKAGRRKNTVPDIGVIRGFLSALGGALLVDNGRKVKCGVCKKKFKLIPNRPIMGSIRYFEKTHLIRCKGMDREMEGKKLVTDVLGVKKKIARKTATPDWDEIRGERIVAILTDSQSVQGDCHKKSPGRPKKGSKLGKKESETYFSKRKQALFAVLVCPLCDVVFKTNLEVEDHFRSQHGEGDGMMPYKCLACCRWIPGYEEMVSHLDAEHNYKACYICELCEQQFETQSKLNKHISEQHPEVEVAFSCKLCTKSYQNFPALKAHQRAHHSVIDQLECNTLSEVDIRMMVGFNEAFTCRFCNADIMHGKALEDHIKAEHFSELSMGTKPFSCHICLESSPQEFDTFYHVELHLLKSHGISLENICRFCKRASNNTARFLAHFKEMHPNDMPYECPRLGCERQFGKSNRLKDHLLLHRLKEGDITEDMKKLCNECGKVFYFQKKLDEHTKYVHKGLKKQKKDFHCHLCVKTYNSNSQLQAHIRKHEGNASFMCDICGKGFYRNDRLRIHNNTVHLGQKRFQCSVCEKKFIDNYKLKRHMRTHDTREGPDIVATTLIKKKLSKKSLLRPPVEEVTSPLDYSIEDPMDMAGTGHSNVLVDARKLPTERIVLPPYSHAMTIMNNFIYPATEPCNTHN